MRFLVFGGQAARQQSPPACCKRCQPTPAPPTRLTTRPPARRPRRPLRAAAPSIFEGLAELFELYLLHVFVTFGDVSLAELQQAALTAAHAGHGGATAQLGGGGYGGSGGVQDAALTPRLRAALLRVAQDSIGKYRQMFAAHPGSRLARALAPPAAAPSPAAAAAGPAGQRPPSAAGSSSGGGASQYFRRTLPGSAGSSPAPLHGVGPAAAAASGHGPGTPPAGPPGAVGAAAAAAAAAAVPAAPAAVEVSVLSNAGNLYGLLERLTAVECLLEVGRRLLAARGALAAALPPGEGAHALETFFSRTVGAAEDLRDFLVGTGGYGWAAGYVMGMQCGMHQQGWQPELPLRVVASRARQ